MHAFDGQTDGRPDRILIARLRLQLCIPSAELLLLLPRFLVVICSFARIAVITTDRFRCFLLESDNFSLGSSHHCCCCYRCYSHAAQRRLACHTDFWLGFLMRRRRRAAW